MQSLTINKLIMDNKLTYDLIFSDSENSNSKGFKEGIEFCRAYIDNNNGTNESYFSDYKGGTVSIVCNETGKSIFETEIK